MPYDFTLTAELAATPADVFDAWLSSEGHTAMTGGIAHVSAELDAEYDAWDGYISGRNLELEPGRRIVQSWRTRNFAAHDPDSIIEITLQASATGTRLTLVHKNVPDGQTSYEQGGWQSHYFEPMQRRFTWMQRDTQ